VSASQSGDVVTYIDGQAAHHAKRSYEEGSLAFLKRYGVTYDPADALG
jgi:hypothetical protein